MTILDKIQKPTDLRLLKTSVLPVLAQEIRDLMIDTTSKTGGHLGAGLGVVELTIALHYVLNSPKDKIVWDVGHQAYPHKILTGRAARFSTLRQQGGLSGFPKIGESEHDAFGTGHSSTSISAALGMAVANEKLHEGRKIVAVIGDGSMTGGIAFEGLQNAGLLGSNLLVILNDNQMFISHRIGALGNFLTRLLTLGLVKRVENRIERILRKVKFLGSILVRLARRFRVLLFPGMLFEEMGFSYFGPVDGHDISHLIPVLKNLLERKGPVLLHVVTQKGRGYAHAEKKPVAFHGISSFDIQSGDIKTGGSEISYTQMFSRTVCRLARKDNRIMAITAAMPEGTGLDAFAREFPDRFFDVGIAEQHALTFSAGLARAGLTPVCAMYSTFLQRGIDQVIHDIALQSLPVVMIIDRGGIVGEDGPTHHGVFDITFLRMIPNMTIMSPKDENELQHMIYTAIQLKKPVAVRFPRGSGLGVRLDEEFNIIPYGKAEILRSGGSVCLAAVGRMVPEAVKAAEILHHRGISCGVINMRFIKPIDAEVLKPYLNQYKTIFTIEEGTLAGGFGNGVQDICEGTNTNIVRIGLPDVFIEHAPVKVLLEKYGLTGEAIARTVESRMMKSHPHLTSREKTAVT
ncbi:MAG: 1-deoxy-D-xylulose-5-phosphate synthase [bacterium]